MDRFVVEVKHHDGTQIVQTDFMVTSRCLEAVKSARCAEDYGFVLSAVGTSTSVKRFREGVVYKRTRGSDQSIVFQRIIQDGAWREEWFDERIREACQTAVIT